MFLATKCEPSIAKLKLVHDIGFRHLELYVAREWITKSVANRLLSFTFDYVVHAPTDYFDESVIEFARAIGAKGINTHKIVPDEKIQKLLELANRYNMFLTIEVEGRPDPKSHRAPIIPTFNPINTLQDWIRQRETTPGVGLCVDVEHAIVRNIYPEVFAFGLDIKHVHLTGYIDEETGHERPIYENPVQTEKVARLLRSIDYDGFVVCEHDVEFHTLDVWKRTFDEYKHLFEE